MSEHRETIEEQDARFDEIHAALAEVGLCDGTGGMEYTRVKGEWVEQGRPDAIAAFIENRSRMFPFGDAHSIALSLDLSFEESRGRTTVVYSSPDPRVQAALGEIYCALEDAMARIRKGDPTGGWECTEDGRWIQSRPQAA